MPQQRIADLRKAITTMSEAAHAMQQIAAIECELAYQAARAERRIEAIKATHAELTETERAQHDEFANALATFITANPEMFRKPRKVATDWGSFGLQEVCSVEIADPEAVIDWALEQGYDDCVRTVRTPDKGALKTRLLAGENVPGVTLNQGDTAVYKVARTLLDDARERALRT